MLFICGVGINQCFINGLNFGVLICCSSLVFGEATKMIWHPDFLLEASICFSEPSEDS